MTQNQIEKRMQQEMVPYQLAKQIRELLDAAKKSYGAQDWTDADVEQRISELVFED